MVFNTTQAWITRSNQYSYRKRKRQYIQSYTYLRVKCLGESVPLWEVACAQHSHGYAALGTLERQCTYIQFQESLTKLWLDTLETPTLLYGRKIWGLILYRERKWKDLEISLALMTACMIMNKAFVC